MANSTGKIASAGAAKAATAAPPKGKTRTKPAPASKSSANRKGKDAPAVSESTSETAAVTPPSHDSSVDNSRSSKNDSFSYSKEGYYSRNVTTESTTRLVDNLVETYTGDHSGIDSHDHDSFHKDSSGTTSSPYSEHGHDCPHSPDQAQKRFQRLDDASRQLGVAQKKVDAILDKAVEARISDSKPVPEADEKRAEAEQERLTKAEGRLHRTRERLSEKQEFRRQRKLEYTAKREDAEKALLAKYGHSSAELRDHIMETFRPVIAQDSAARNDIHHLENAADWHLKTDSEASRLVREGEAAVQKEPREQVEGNEEVEDAGPKKETKLFASANEKKAAKDERRRVRLKKIEKKKRKELECRLDGDAFRRQVRNTSVSERTSLVETELNKLDKSTSSAMRKEFESRLNEQLSDVQVRQTRGSGKEDDKRRKAVETLIDVKAQRSGNSGQELNPICEAIEDLDTESIQKTHKKLEGLDLGSITSVVDIERSFGRDITEVRTDLDQQIARGGKSVPKARKTLSRLDKLVRRSQLMSEGDGWDALMSCITPSGPNLSGFLGLPNGSTGGRCSAAELNNNSRVDFTAARRITRRMAQSGRRVDDKRKAKLLAQLQNAV